MYRVVIVEDDYMISALNRSYAEKDGRFEVVKAFSSGKAALKYLATQTADLLILDVYMPQMTGTELLRQLRAGGSTIDVIVVSAAQEADTLAELLGLGVIDYLVKPFGALRFAQALERFCQKRQALQGQEQIRQTDIDRLLNLSHGSPFPKGLQEKTLEKIRAALHSHEEQSCETIAADAGLSVVTARRYLNFLLENYQAQSRIKYDTGGRPCVVYRLPDRF